MSEQAKIQHILNTPAGQEAIRERIALAVAQAKHELREDLADQSEIMRRAALLQLSGQLASAMLSNPGAQPMAFDEHGMRRSSTDEDIAKRAFTIAKAIVRLSWGVEDQGDGPNA